MNEEYNIVNNKIIIIIKTKKDIYYHGSNTIIKIPDLEHSRTDIDFGKGFYLTDDIYQAHKWACRKRHNAGKNITNSYKLSFTGLKIKHFDLDLDWLEFVIANRTYSKPAKTYDEYDIIIGPIANDKLFDTIDMYQSGLISAENAIKIMNCMDYGEQTALKTEKAIRNLNFLAYKELKGLEKENYMQAFKQDTKEASHKAQEMIKKINQGIQI